MFFSLAGELFAQGTVRWTGATNTDWGTAGNWAIVSGTPSTPPGVADDVQIGTVAIHTNEPIVGSATTINSLTYGNVDLSTLTINANLTVTGAITNTIATTARVHNISIATGAILSAGSANLSPAVAAANMTFTFTGTAAFTISGNFTAQPTTATTVIRLTVGTGSFSVGGTTLQGAAAATARNCIISASTGSLTFSGPYTKNGSGSTLTTSGAANVTFGSNVTNTLGAFTLNAATTTTFSGSGNVTPAVAMTFGHVTINNTITTTTVSAAGTLTIAGNLLLNGTGTLAGTEPVLLTGSTRTIDGTGTISVPTTVSAVHSILATANLTVFGAITMSGTAGDINNSGTVTASSINGTVAGATWTQSAATAVLNISGTMLTTGTLTATTAGNTVNYNGTGAQTIKVASYSNLIISGTRTTNNVTVAGAVNIANVFTFSATFTSGSFVVTGSTIAYNGTGAQTVLALNYNNLTVSGARTINVVTWESAGAIGVAGTLTVSATFTSGSHTTTSTTINLNGSGAQTFAASTVFFNYNNLIISNAGTKTAAGNIIVNGDITVQDAAVFSGGTSRTHNLYGNIIFNTSAGSPYTFTTASTLNFNTPTIPAATSISGTTVATLGFNTINMNNTSGFSSTENFNATGTITIAASVTFTNTTTVSVSTSLAGTGTFINTATGTLNLGNTITITTLTATAVGNIVNYNRNNTQTIKATTYDILQLSNAGAKTAGGALTVNGDFTIDGTASFTQGSNLTHIFFGNWIINTTATTPFTGTNNSIVRFNEPTPAAATSISGSGTGTGTFRYVTFNNPSGFSNSKNFTVALSESVTTGSTFTNNAAITVTTSLTGVGTFINTATGIVNIGNTVTISNLNATAVGNTVNYNRNGAQTILAITYHHLQLSTANVKTAGGALTVNGNLTLQGTATFALGSNLTHNFYGNWIINTTTATPFTATNNTVVNFNEPTPAAATSISGSNASTGVFRNVTINNASGFSTAKNFSTALTMTVSGGVAFTNNAVVTVTTSLTGTGAFINSATGTLNLAGTTTITTLTATAVGNIVNYSGASQTVFAATYDILQFSTSGAKLAGGALTVNGNFTLQGTATFNMGTSLTHNFAGSWIINTSAAAPLSFTTSSTINFNSPGVPAATSITGTTTATLGFNNVNVSNTSGFSSTENFNVTGTLSVAVGATFTNSTTVSVTTALTGAGTVVNSATGTLNLVGTTTITTLTATAAGNIVNYNGAAQTILATTYDVLRLSTSGAKLAGGALTVNGAFTLQGTATFNMGTSLTHNFANSWTINTSAVTPLSFTTSSTINFNTPGIPAATSITGTTTATLTFNNVNMNNTSGFSSTENFSVTGTLTVATGVTFTPSVTTMQINPAAANGTITGDGTVIVNRTAATPDYSTQYRFTTNTLTNMTVEYNSASAQTISAVNYGNLVSSSSGTRTLATAGTIGIAGTFTPGTNTYTITSSTINFNGSGPQTIPAFNFNNLTSSSSGTRTLINGGTIGIAGLFIPGTNSYTITGSTIDFNGNSPQAIPVFTYNNVILTATGSVIKTISGAVMVDIDLTVGVNNILTITGAGSVQINTGNLILNGSLDNSGVIEIGL